MTGLKGIERTKAADIYRENPELWDEFLAPSLKEGTKEMMHRILLDGHIYKAVSADFGVSFPAIHDRISIALARILDESQKEESPQMELLTAEPMPEPVPEETPIEPEQVVTPVESLPEPQLIETPPPVVISEPVVVRTSLDDAFALFKEAIAHYIAEEIEKGRAADTITSRVNELLTKPQPRYTKLEAQTIEGMQGYYLDDIQAFLKEAYPEFLKWYKGDGARIDEEGKQYILVDYVKPFLNQLTHKP